MVLSSDRLDFRPMTEDDTDLVLKWRNSDAVRNNFLYRQEITREQHLKRYNTKVKTGEIIQFIIIDRELNKPIGSVYLRDVDPVRKSAEYGVFIGEESARGKGYGSETAGRIVKYFFEEMKYIKLYLRVLSDNTAAINSYKSAGFTETDDNDIAGITENGEKVIMMAISVEQKESR